MEKASSNINNAKRTETKDLKNLYVISCIFNPAGFKGRTNLYKNFEAHILSSNVNLITIECLFAHQTEFSVTEKTNPCHIQVHAKDPIWIKENLINIAISRLPSTWKYVLWLDSDIEFLLSDWPQKILNAFEKYDFIQCFNYSHFLGPNNEKLETHFSMMYAYINEIPIERKHFKQFYPHPGYGWGISRKGYETIDNNIIDFSIVGSGDMFMSFCLIGRVKDCLDFYRYSEEYQKKILNWQEKVEVLKELKRIGYADVPIQHYFHGFRQDRQYVNRHEIIFNNNYNPETDLFYNEDGVIQLKASKADMISSIKDYFFSRKEDRKIEQNEEKVISNYLSNYKLPEEILVEAEKLKQQVKNQEMNSHDAKNNNLLPIDDSNAKNIYSLINGLTKNNNIGLTGGSDNNFEEESNSVKSHYSYRTNTSDIMNGKKLELHYETGTNISGNMNTNDNTSNSNSEDSSVNFSDDNKSYGSERELNDNKNLIDEMVIQYGNKSSNAKDKDQKKQKVENPNSKSTDNKPIQSHIEVFKNYKIQESPKDNEFVNEIQNFEQFAAPIDNEDVPNSINNLINEEAEKFETEKKKKEQKEEERKKRLLEEERYSAQANLKNPKSNNKLKATSYDLDEDDRNYY